MKIANFWLERDHLTVKVLSEGAFKDKKSGTRIFKIGCRYMQSNYKKNLSSTHTNLTSVATSNCQDHNERSLLG